MTEVRYRAARAAKKIHQGSVAFPVQKDHSCSAGKICAIERRWWKYIESERESDQREAWLTGRRFETFVTTSLLSFDSFRFVCFSSVLDKESLDLKVLAISK